MSGMSLSGHLEDQVPQDGHHYVVTGEGMSGMSLSGHLEDQVPQDGHHYVVTGEGDPDLLTSCSLVVKDAPDLNQKHKVVSSENDSNVAKVVVGQFKFKHLSPAEKRLDEILREDNDLKDEMRKRNFMVKAIKTNSEPINQTLLWEGDNLADQLIEKGCLTSEENAIIRKTRTGNINQMRIVLILLLNRDFKTLLAFVGSLLEFNSKLAEMVMKSYDQFLSRDTPMEIKCTFCQMKFRVHISIVTDKLWKEYLVDDQFVGNVSKLDVCLGGQDDFWNQIARNTESVKVLSEVLAAIEMCGFHSDIAELVREDQEQGVDKLECRCGPRMALLKPHESSNGDYDSGNGLEQDELEDSSSN